MAGRIQYEGAILSLDVVRTLLRQQAPEIAGLPLEALSNTGSDNVLYRLGTEFVVRLPRFSDAARRWAVVVGYLRRMAVADAPARQPGERGGPLHALDARLRWWLARADGLVDVRAVTRLWEECLEAADEPVQPTVVHGDLIPGNLLVADARLAAVLDWGALGAGDPAQDLDPAWSVLDPAGAAAFRQALDVDEASWLRGRGFALEQAVGGVITYIPHRHPLGHVMQRTLDRLLSWDQTRRARLYV